MAVIVAFEVEIGGINQVLTNLDQIKQATRETNTEFGRADRGTDEYKRLQRQLAVLQNAQKSVRAETRNAGREAVIQADQGQRSYRALNAELVNARMRFKELTQAERQGAVGQNLLTSIRALDTELKEIDASIGSFQRNVGNYRQALIRVGDVVTGGLITGGIQQIAGTVVRGFNEAIQTIREFETGLANLSALTGLTGDDLDELGQRAIVLSTQFGTSATDILEGFRLVGSASPELLGSAEALAAVTEQADILARASGQTLPQAADSLTRALNQYSLSADQAEEVTNILATSQQRGTATIAQLTESLTNVGSILNAANISISDSTVLLQGLARGGITGARAGTQLRGVITRLADTQRDELNPATNDFNDILEVLSTEILDVSDATQLFGRENAAAALTLIEQRNTVRNLTGAMRDLSPALDQARTNTDTAAAAGERMTAEWNALVLSIDSGDGALSNFSRRVSDDTSSILEAFRLLNQGVVTSFSEFNAVVGGSLESRRRAVERLTLQAEEAQNAIAGTTGTATRRLAGGFDEALQSLDQLNASIADSNRRLVDLTSDLGNATEGTAEYAQVQADIAFVENRLAATRQIITDRTADLTEETEASTDATRRQLNALELAELAQQNLETQIRLSILAGNENEEQIEAWQAEQVRLNAVSERFTEIQRALIITTSQASQSITAITAEVRALRTELNAASGGDIAATIEMLIDAETRLQEAQNELARARSLAAGGTGVLVSDVQPVIDGINLISETRQAAARQQLQDQAVLERELERIALQTAISISTARLRLFAEDSRERLELENQLQQQIQSLDNFEGGVSLDSQILAQEMVTQAQLDANDLVAQTQAQLDANRQAILLENEAELLRIRIANAGASTEEAVRLQVLLDQIIREQGLVRTQETIETEEARVARIMENVGVIAEGLDAAFSVVGQTIENQANDQVAAVEDRYDREIELAEGNEDRITQLERQKAAEIEAIEREAFERNKRLQIAQILTQAAAGVINILAQTSILPSPLDIPERTRRLIQLGIATAAQIATVAGTSFAEGGYTGPGKGQKKDHTGHRAVGTVHANEYVVPPSVALSAAARPHLNILEAMRLRPGPSRQTVVPGMFQTGGLTTPQLQPNIDPGQAAVTVVQARASFTPEEVQAIASAIASQTGEAVEGAIVSAMDQAGREADRRDRLNARTS